MHHQSFPAFNTTIMTGSTLLDQQTYLQQRQHWLQGEWSGAMARPAQAEDRYITEQSLPYRETPRAFQTSYMPPTPQQDYSALQYGTGTPWMPYYPIWEPTYDVQPLPDQLADLQVDELQVHDYSHDEQADMSGPSKRKDAGLSISVEERGRDVDGGPKTAGTRLAEEYLNFPVTAISPDTTFGALEPEAGNEGESADEQPEGTDSVDMPIARSISPKFSAERDPPVAIALAAASPPGREDVPSLRVVPTVSRQIRSPQELRAAVFDVSRRFYTDMLETLTNTSPEVFSGVADDRDINEILRLTDEVRNLHLTTLDSPRRHAPPSHTDQPTSYRHPPIPSFPPTQDSPSSKLSASVHGTKVVQSQAGMSTGDLPTPKYMLGPWHPSEVAQLRTTIDRARAIFDAKFLIKKKRSQDEADDGVDWDWVVKQMGCSRSRHQILCKAVELGLKSPWVRRGVKGKRRKASQAQVS